MGRKRKNIRHQAAIARFARVFTDSRFWEHLCSFAERWRARGCPNLLFERYVDWDEARRCPLYYGLYYDLRDLCDSYGLLWPDDGGYLVQLLSLPASGGGFKEILDYILNARLSFYGATLSPGFIQSALDSIKPDDCPPQEHWQWFRMARNGLGLPRPQELEGVSRATPHRVSSGNRPRPVDRGLTYDEIAEKFHTNSRTVQDAIQACWQYFEHHGDCNRIGQLAGLDEFEIGALMFAIDARKLKRSGKRSGKSVMEVASTIFAQVVSQMISDAQMKPKPEK